MEEVQQQIKTRLQEIISDLYNLKNQNIQLDLPDLVRGDFSSNIALIISKEVGKNPSEIAEEIVKKLKITPHLNPLPKGEEDQGYVIKMEVAGAGFINFWIKPEFLIREVQFLLEKTNPTSPSEARLRGARTIVVEFTDPNPFKEFHIGHLYSNIIGESIARLLETTGANVIRVNYQGDVGMHVAKALYGIKNQELRIKEMGDKSIQERAKFLGEAYAMGANAYEENEAAKAEIQKINKQVYEKDPSIYDLYEKGKKWSLEYFDEIYKRLGTKFIKLYFESSAAPKGVSIVKDHLDDGIFEKDNGAIVFKGEKYGLHTRVFINSLELPTYEAKELGLAVTKDEDFHYDESIIITGNEINEYFKVLLKVLSLIYPDLAKKTKHLSHGMVRLPSGKMSSRSGEIITAEWLLEQVEEKVKQIMSGEKLNNNEKIAVIDQIVVGAVKYSLLKSGIGQDVKFDLDSSVSLEGDSGPYLQYTYARTRSILEKLEIRNSKLEKGRETSHYEKFDVKNGDLGKLEKEELQLLQMLNRYKLIVRSATEKFAPNLLAGYLFDLAKLYNLFYQLHPIIKAEAHQQKFRLMLTTATGEVLKSGLYLLGIKAPEKM